MSDCQVKKFQHLSFPIIISLFYSLVQDDFTLEEWNINFICLFFVVCPYIDLMKLLVLLRSQVERSKKVKRKKEQQLFSVNFQPSRFCFWILDQKLTADFFLFSIPSLSLLTAANLFKCNDNSQIIPKGV